MYLLTPELNVFNQFLNVFVNFCIIDLSGFEINS